MAVVLGAQCFVVCPIFFGSHLLGISWSRRYGMRKTTKYVRDFDVELQWADEVKSTRAYSWYASTFFASNSIFNTEEQVR